MTIVLYGYIFHFMGIILLLAQAKNLGQFLRLALTRLKSEVVALALSLIHI